MKLFLALMSVCILTTVACGDTGEPIDTATAVGRGLRPMPILSKRCAAVHAELGDEIFSVRSTLRMEDGRLLVPYRLALKTLSKKARASLRRHNVHPLQFARYLQKRG